MGKASPPAIVLDSGALIALERGDARMRALCREALRVGARVVVPSAVIARVMRRPAQQVVIRALLDGPTTETPVLDRLLAEAAGVLCARTGTADVVDATVVLVARRERAAVVSSDPKDLHRLDPTLRVEVV